MVKVNLIFSIGMQHNYPRQDQPPEKNRVLDDSCQVCTCLPVLSFGSL